MKMGFRKKGAVSLNLNDLRLVVAAFLTYTGMYAIRKSFLAGSFSGYEDIYSMDFKTVLIISQVFGYMLSKFIGIKVISEMKPKTRFISLISFVSFGLLMLLAFQYVPNKFKPLTLFFNGLPLGMVFGIVLSYLEGRKSTEFLVAGLSATFVVSTGFIKTTGLWLMQDFHVNESFMPFFTGLIFFPVFIISAWILHTSEKPSGDDIECRTERIPMNKSQKKEFRRKYGYTFFLLVAIYVLFTVVRDFRDNFIVDFWHEAGFDNQPFLITATELPIALVVVILSSLGILIANNKTAYKTGIIVTLFSAAVLLSLSIMFSYHTLSPIAYIVISGTAIYLPYILFHNLIFERFVASIKFRSTISYLFYIADSLGYLLTIIILILKETLTDKISWADFFTQLNIYTAVIILAIVVWVLNIGRRQIKENFNYGSNINLISGPKFG